MSNSGTTGIVSCTGNNQLQFFDITMPNNSGLVAVGFNNLRNNAVNNSHYAVIDYPSVILASYNPILGPKVLLPTGIDPTFLAISGTTLAVISGNDSVVNIFDTNNPVIPTGTFTLPSGSDPQFCALNGTCLVVSCQGSGELSVIDTSIPQILGTISIGGTVQRVALAGEYGAVGNTANNTVTTFNTSTLQVINTYATGDGPYRLAVSGDIGVTSNRGSDTLTVFSLTQGAEPVEYALPGVNFGSAKATVEQLNAMSVSGDWLNATADFYAELIDLAAIQAKQRIAIIDTGSQHKVIQYQIEKLDLLLHKELDAELYSDKKGTRGFLIAGYDNFSQSSVSGYPGYRVDHYYQLLGASHDYNCMKFLGAVGASESYEKLNPSDYRAIASYNTVWADLGGSLTHNRWQFGLDGLFGYSFIEAKRSIQFLNRHLHTHHGMWNVSVDAKASYSFEYQKMKITPYDNLGYIYGHENDYHEKGSEGANLAISNENISMIRNQFGLRFAGPVHKEAFNVFMDGAWVYEYYFGDNTYIQRFLGSTITAVVTQTVPTKNYGRINTGIEGTHRNFDWKLAYTGLFGKNLSDSAISVKFGYKF
jgi:uncharacterized protein YhjY with autotransporter beta-barrel domain